MLTVVNQRHSASNSDGNAPASVSNWSLFVEVLTLVFSGAAILHAFVRWVLWVGRQRRTGSEAVESPDELAAAPAQGNEAAGPLIPDFEASDRQGMSRPASPASMLGGSE